MGTKLLIDRNNMVMKAHTVGFFYDFGKRCKTCRHGSCGWESIRYKYCRWITSALSNNGNWWDSSEKKEYLKHKKKACETYWCIVDHGKRPEGELIEKSIPCKKTYFKAYTTKQLSDPSTKVELAAVKMTVAEHDRCPRYGIVAVYDLMNDRWYNDKWWKTTEAGSLAPVDKKWDSPEYAPKDIYGIDEVIAKVKAGI